MNIENSNREAIVNQAVDYLLQIWFFKSKFCNRNKKPCVNVKWLLKEEKEQQMQFRVRLTGDVKDAKHIIL